MIKAVKNDSKPMMWILGLLVCITFQSGCARSVTEKNTLLSMDITIQYAASIDLSKFNYGIIFSSHPPQTPIPPTLEILPTPGFAYNESDPILLTHNGIQYYYETYFDTWSDYIYLTNQDTSSQLISSNTSNFSSSTTLNSNYPPKLQFEHTTTLTNDAFRIQFPIEQLSISPSTLYVTFFVTEKTIQGGITYSSGKVIDISQSENQFINRSAQQEAYNTEEQNSTIPSAGDIISWHIKIY